MYLHTPALEAGSWWRVDTASGTNTPTTVYAHDGADAIPTALGSSGSTVRGDVNRDGQAFFWSSAATLYCKELTYQGVPTGTVVTSTGVTPTAPVGGAPVDIATISTLVAALPTTYVKLLVTDATSTTLTGTLVAGHLSPVDCTAGAGARTLPAAASVAAGTPTVAKKADTSANALVVSRAGSDLVFGTGAGATSKTLTLSGEAITFVSNGVDRWSIESSDTPSGSLANTYLKQTDATSTYVPYGTPTTDAPGLGLYFPEAHGAKGDYTHFTSAGVNINDAAMTSGSAVLTCATTTPFVPTDVGKRITVPGAGAAGVALYSTITGFTSASAVTLADTASSTVSAKTISYGTDDTTAIQAALNAAKVALGGIVFLRGRRYLALGLTMDGNSVTLMGTGIGDTASGGMGTMIAGWATMSSTTDLVSVTGGKCSIRNLTLSGNSAGRDVLRLSNAATRFIGDSLIVQSAGVGNGITHGTSVTSVTNKWSNIYVSNCAGAGISVNSSDTEWLNVTTFQNAGDGMTIVGTSAMVSNLHTWGNTGNGLTLTGAANRVANIYTETNTGDGVNITSIENKVNGRAWNNTGRGAYVTGDRNELQLNCVDNRAEGAYIFTGVSNKILGGQFYDDQGTKTQTYGVRIGSGATNTYVGAITAFDGDHVTAGLLDGSTSTAWELGARRLTLAAPVVYNASTTLTDILTAGSCKAGRKFYLDATLFVDGAQAADLKVRVYVNGGTGPSGYYSVHGPNVSATSTTASSILAANTAVVAASGGAIESIGLVGVGSIQAIRVSGYVVVGTADASVALQTAQSTSDATDTTIHTGSWMELRPTP